MTYRDVVYASAEDLPKADTSVSVAVDPDTKTVKKGESATFTASAGGDGVGVLSYQWFTNDSDSNEGGTEIEGATEAEYTSTTFTTPGTKYYYVEATRTKSGISVKKVSAVQKITVCDVYTISCAALNLSKKPTISMNTADTADYSDHFTYEVTGDTAADYLCTLTSKVGEATENDITMYFTDEDKKQAKAVVSVDENGAFTVQVTKYEKPFLGPMYEFYYDSEGSVVNTKKEGTEYYTGTTGSTVSNYDSQIIKGYSIGKVLKMNGSAKLSFTTEGAAKVDLYWQVRNDGGSSKLQIKKGTSEEALFESDTVNGKNLTHVVWILDEADSYTVSKVDGGAESVLYYASVTEE
jgi:hypothetical protein